ncbi:hypothetical protein IM40_11325 (plasmid) [Candidatus Paracaedimonas acanthamoebae]|nr:hypothetical protein IM40_11325 [Candidatus Paracaedimonas acanthamoebae]
MTRKKRLKIATVLWKQQADMEKISQGQINHPLPKSLILVERRFISIEEANKRAFLFFNSYTL